MSTLTTHRAAATVRYDSTTAAPMSAAHDVALSQALIAEAIGCIIEGRALPEHLRPRAVAAPRPATVQEGIARILGG